MNDLSYIPENQTHTEVIKKLPANSADSEFITDMADGFGFEIEAVTIPNKQQERRQDLIVIAKPFGYLAAIGAGLVVYNQIRGR